MWFSKPKTKTYTVTSPKQAGYTTDLTMKLPLGFEAPIEQINMWMRRAALMEKCGDREIKDQKSIIDKQATEIQCLQAQLQQYATKTYTLTAPKWMNNTTDLTMNLPVGFDVQFAQIAAWLRRNQQIEECDVKSLFAQKDIIRKQDTEIQCLQEQLKWYATEATEIRDELDAKVKRCEGDVVALSELYRMSVDYNCKLCEELEETEDAYCELYEAYEKLFEAAGAKTAKKGAKKNGK